MEFSITIARCHGVAPATATTRYIAGGDFTIGRNPDSDLPLSDSERVISGRHARLELRDGALWVADLSTNGTFLNQNPERLAAHEPVRLAAGDTLSVGPYDLVIGAAGLAPTQPDPFDLADQQDGAGLTGDAGARDILDLLDSSEPADHTAPSIAPVPNRPAPPDPFADAQALDPFLAAAAPPPPAALATPAPTPFEHVHFRAPEIRPAAAPEPTAGPAPTARGQPLVPDDYDLLADDLGPREADPFAAFEAPATPAAVTPPPFADWPASPDAPVDQAPAQSPIPAALASRTPPPVAPIAAAGAAPPTPGAGADAGLAAFLAGLGAGEAQVIADPGQFLHAAGRLLRELTAGLTTTMQSRAQFKSELRLGVTTIRAAENNPFKFSVNADEALERLLFRPGSGFLGGEEAARRAFEDVQAHEMAMIAGLRAALRALLARFEPAELERRLGAASGFDKLMPMARRARYWDMFTDLYDEVAADASEDFMQLFGDAFTQAYEDQVHRLMQARRQQAVAPGP